MSSDFVMMEFGSKDRGSCINKMDLTCDKKYASLRLHSRTIISSEMVGKLNSVTFCLFELLHNMHKYGDPEHFLKGFCCFVKCLGVYNPKT